MRSRQRLPLFATSLVTVLAHRERPGHEPQGHNALKGWRAAVREHALRAAQLGRGDPGLAVCVGSVLANLAEGDAAR